MILKHVVTMCSADGFDPDRSGQERPCWLVLHTLVLFHPFEEEQTDRNYTDLQSERIGRGPKSVCLFFFDRVEKDKGGAACAINGRLCLRWPGVSPFEDTKTLMPADDAGKLNAQLPQLINASILQVVFAANLLACGGVGRVLLFAAFLVLLGRSLEALAVRQRARSQGAFRVAFHNC